MSETGDRQRKHRNPGIDVLRGLSIVLVVLFHINLRIPVQNSDLATFLPKRLLTTLTTNGFEGVFIFFVISGFLITSNMLVRNTSLAQVDLRAFYVRRAARILPLLLVLVGVLSLLHLVGVPSFTIDLERQTLGETVASALFLHLNWYEATTGYLPGAWDVLWSLSIEEAFYLGFPVLCVLTRRQWILIVGLSILAGSLPLTRSAITDNPIWMSKAYLPGMAAIAAGVIAALLSPRLRAERRGFGMKWVGALGVFGVLAFPDLLWPIMGHGLVLCLTLSTAVLLVGLDLGMRSDNVRRSWIGLSWLRSFGRLSYEIYLTHMFVVEGVTALAEWMGSSSKSGYWWYLPSLAVTWAIGHFIARMFTDPSNRKIRQKWKAV